MDFVTLSLWICHTVTVALNILSNTDTETKATFLRRQWPDANETLLRLNSTVTILIMALTLIVLTVNTDTSDKTDSTRHYLTQKNWVLSKLKASERQWLPCPMSPKLSLLLLSEPSRLASFYAKEIYLINSKATRYYGPFGKTTVIFSAVQCSAVQYSAVHCTALHCTVVQCCAVHCSVLQCCVVHCSVLQRSGVQCSAV